MESLLKNLLVAQFFECLSIVQLLLHHWFILLPLGWGTVGSLQGKLGPNS